ncbi:uncharacterized protein plekhg6 [Brachyhypopomus gauderio]|uniref:uncharacterized protein plekhg6 n=1 Tax=Brachyhypopomus gauderio TaxID=698409 RepID=UPI0040415234
MSQPPDKVNASDQGMDVELEHQKEVEKESDSDGNLTHATVPLNSHKRAANKQKYHTLGNQKKKQRHPVGYSTVSKGTNANTKTRGTVMPATFTQGYSEKMEERSGTGGLDPMEVLKHTLETFPVPVELSWDWAEGGRAKALEHSWTDIVHGAELMPKIQRHQQEALWEFIHTELIYINKLTIVKDLVMAALEYVHQWGFLHEVSSDQLFSNLPSILDAHRLFWQEVLFPVLQDTRQTGQPFDPLKLDPGCLQFSERFSAYLDYCWEEEKNVEFTRRQQETNPHFQIFVMWVETHPQCRRMRLGDMQAKPHQRITKYPLLLKAILKTTQDPPTQHALHRMLDSVTQFLDSINDYLQFKDDEMDLFELSQRIEGYELQGMGEEIDKHVQEFCHFDLTCPVRGAGPKDIRKLLLDDLMKVRGRKDNKLEVNVLLFTDVLLLTKAQKKTEKQKVVLPPLALERIHCAELKDGYSFVLVEMSDLGCPVSVYSVCAPSPERCTVWISTINQAQKDLESLRKKDIIQSNEPSDLVELEEAETSLTPTTEDTKQQPEGPLEDENTFSQVKAGLPVPGNVSETKDVPQVQNEKRTEAAQMNHFGSQMQNRDRKLNDKATQSEERSTGLIHERRVTWKHRALSPMNSDDISQRDLPQSNGPHPLLEGTGPSQPPCNGGEEHEVLTNSGRFARKIKSPKIRRKRPVNSQSSAPPRDPRTTTGETELSVSVTNSNSFSNSDSDSNQSPSNVSSKPADSHLVLKLGSIKHNSGVLWNAPHENLSPEPQDLSGPEPTKETPRQNSLKEPKIKSQRSSSIPQVIYTGAHSFPEPSPSPPPGLDPQQYPSPLQDLLARAKERERGRGVLRRDGRPVGRSVSSVSAITYGPTTPSPLPAEGELGVKAQKTAASGPRLNLSPYTLKGSSMQDDEKDERHRVGPGTPAGASVDWAGWCFDDDEVLRILGPDGGSLAWVNKALKDEHKEPSRQEENEYSEV